MLLRSTPILNSWTRQTSLETPSRYISLTHTTPSSIELKKMTRALSEPDLRDFSAPKIKATNRICTPDMDTTSLDCGVCLGSSDSGECSNGLVEVLVGGGEIGGDGSGKFCGGPGADGSFSGDSSRGNEGVDDYYQKLISSDPDNSLVLSNYARYLKEVRGNLSKAEEYCSRAILANPNDGNVLSMYADLVWRSDKDSIRAETYFNQAVESNPDDCYVLASYARFLWDAEEDEDGEEGVEVEQSSGERLFNGPTSRTTPLTAAS